MCSTTCWCSHLLKPLNSLRIYFYWICRGQEEFDWFCDLLSDAAEGPAAGIVDITLFLTGEVELSQVSFLVFTLFCTFADSLF